jgi:hypothetical protein
MNFASVLVVLVLVVFPLVQPDVGGAKVMALTTPTAANQDCHGWSAVRSGRVDTKASSTTTDMNNRPSTCRHVSTSLANGI